MLWCADDSLFHKDLLWLYFLTFTCLGDRNANLLGARYLILLVWFV